MLAYVYCTWLPTRLSHSSTLCSSLIILVATDAQFIAQFLHSLLEAICTLQHCC